MLTKVQQQATASEDEAATKAARVAARQVAVLTANTAYADDEEQYKVWPTNDDRTAFRQVMGATDSHASGCDPNGPGLPFLPQRHQRMDQPGQHGSTRYGPVKRIAEPSAADRAGPGEIDEPQAIFETLNAHGTPLLPADLIKNWLLWEALARS